MSNQDPQKVDQKAPRKKTPVGVVALLVVLAFLLISGLNTLRKDINAANAPSPTPEPAITQEEFVDNLRMAAKVYVIDALNNPETAETDRHEYRVQRYTDEQDKYRVTGKVKAKNGFGVYVTSDFTVELLYDPEAKEYIMVSVNFE